MESTTESKTESPVFRKAASVAAAVTLLQGVAWIILSVIGVLIAWHIFKFGVTDNDVSSSPVFPKNVINCYFPADIYDFGCCYDLLTPGGGLRGIILVYVFMSLVWSCTSVILLYNLWKWSENVPSNTRFWAVVTLVVCLLDLVATILFGVDYGLLDYRLKHSNDLSSCSGATEAPAFLMSLAARGYILWLLNMVAALWLLIASRKIQLNRRSSVNSISMDIPEENLYHEPMDDLKQEIAPTQLKKLTLQNVDSNITPNISTRSHRYRKAQKANFQSQHASSIKAHSAAKVNVLPLNGDLSQQWPPVDDANLKSAYERGEYNSSAILNESMDPIQKETPPIVFPRRPWIDVNHEDTSQPKRNPISLGHSHMKLQANAHHLSPIFDQEQPRSVSPVPDYDLSEEPVYRSAFTTTSSSEFTAPDVTPPSTVIVENWRRQILQKNNQWPQSAESDDPFNSDPRPAPVIRSNRSYRNTGRGYNPIM